MSSAAECKLMQGLFADIVQLALGAVAVSTLVFKRFRERPRRPWRIWFMDVSKQGLGALFAHVLNLLLSALLSWNSSCTDEVGARCHYALLLPVWPYALAHPVCAACAHV